MAFAEDVYIVQLLIPSLFSENTMKHLSLGFSSSQIIPRFISYPDNSNLASPILTLKFHNTQ